jgi:hypothetical protein
MKNRNILLAAVFAMASFFSTGVVSAQDSLSFTAGADVYSNYIWRGTKFGAGPAFQPTVKLTYGGLTAGVWGSYDASGYVETDPFVSYSLPFGLSLGVTDYYYGAKLSDLSDTTGSHTFEANLGYTIGGFTLSANYIVNESGLANAGSKGGDKYVQLGYAFKKFNIFAGAGDGWHTSDTEFKVCNVGIGTSKTIKITDSFSIPVTGQIIVNPDKEILYMVVGVSF